MQEKLEKDIYYIVQKAAMVKDYSKTVGYVWYLIEYNAKSSL